jgi:hypothetical protein
MQARRREARDIEWRLQKSPPCNGSASTCLTIRMCVRYRPADESGGDGSCAGLASDRGLAVCQFTVEFSVNGGLKA